MLSYETFVRTVKDKVSSIGGIPLDKIEFLQGTNQSMDRLSVNFVEHEKVVETCRFHIAEFYEEYCDGEKVDAIVKHMLNNLINIKKQNIYDKVKDINTYDKLKDNLIIRLLNAETNAVDLQDAVYKALGDIALVLYMKISDGAEGFTSTKIRQGMIAQWNEPADVVFRDALMNTYKLYPPRIYKWWNMIANPEYEGDDFMGPNGIDVISQEMMGNCLSTSRKANGAVAIFYPGIAKHLAELLNSDFYMAFTSVHEVMIHKASTIDPEDLVSILHDTMEEATPKEDYLTSKIYKYEKDTGKFSVM